MFSGDRWGHLVGVQEVSREIRALALICLTLKSCVDLVFLNLTICLLTDTCECLSRWSNTTKFKWDTQKLGQSLVVIQAIRSGTKTTIMAEIIWLLFHRGADLQNLCELAAVIELKGEFTILSLLSSDIVLEKGPIIDSGEAGIRKK